jgi:hypothetical protein
MPHVLRRYDKYRDQLCALERRAAARIRSITAPRDTT